MYTYIYITKIVDGLTVNQLSQNLNNDDFFAVNKEY